MSLKAKLEAVIYAAEEPVTLAQLAAIFAEDALLWKTEQDALNLEHAQSLAAAETEPGQGYSDSTVELVELVEAVESEQIVASGDLILATEDAEPTSIEISPEFEAKRAEKRRDRDVREILRGILDELIAEYAADSRGIEIREIAGGFRMGTKPEIHDAVRAFVKSLKPPMKLSLPALETLAVIAYKQPVTAPEVGEIRGVDSAGVLGSLLSRKLIATAGRKQVIGRPILYKTTREFLLRFGLKDVNELPSMEEFEKMAAMELNEELLEGESGETAEQVEHSGDLFAEVEDKTASPYEEDAEQAAGTPDESALLESIKETSIPTAEIAAANTPVERLDEIEVEQ
jgi:segregation and condensation protein B